jgi:hypothetical protein
MSPNVHGKRKRNRAIHIGSDTDLQIGANTETLCGHSRMASNQTSLYAQQCIRYKQVLLNAAWLKEETYHV